MSDWLLSPELIKGAQDILGTDLGNFLPELILCGTIVLLLVLRLFSALDRVHLGWLALVLTAAALVVSADQWADNPRKPQGMFSGLLSYDNFTIFLRLFLLGFASLIIWLSLLTGIPDREDSADFYCLLLGATLGMSLMASANHLLMVYIGVEMASLPSYALAGFLKGRRQSSEAALKYVVYGGGASGIMLYGISLVAGKFGTGYLPDLAQAYLAANLADPVLVLGTLFILIGISFKLAAVPFHFWCPDVFEGAAAEVAAFLSVASKGAALALLGRFVMVLSGAGKFDDVVAYLVPILAVLAAITATFGNLAAYAQTNLKRLLAYSTIAQAGYMVMGLATLRADGVAAVLAYLVAYLFMNLGAFAVVAFLRNLTGSEDLADFRGLVYRAPVLVITLAVFLLSLLGMPPLAGFFAKFWIFSALYDAGQVYYRTNPGLGVTMYALLVIGGLNTVISLVYYIKVLKVMILDKPLAEVEGRPAEPLPLSGGASAYATLLSIVILVLGVFWNPVLEASRGQGVSRLGQVAEARPGVRDQAVRGRLP
jgi:NADH-quinone oxidoreductase subunit N